ncbi:hypothetical protein ACE6H2_015320 [Prunus campanulata]
MCTSQRVESMNKYVKDYLRKGVKLFECISAIDRAMLHLRNTTAKNVFNATYSTPVLKTALTKLEQQASLIYTHRCFVLRDRGNKEVDFGVGFVRRIDIGAVFWIVVACIFWIVIIAGNFSSRSRERIRKPIEKVMAIGVIDKVNVVIALIVCSSISLSSRS